MRRLFFAALAAVVMACIIPFHNTAAQTGRAQVKVAAVDFVPAWGDLDGNVRRLAQAAEEAGRQGVQYAVFPETAVSGYLFSGPDQIAPFLDTIPGKTTAALLPILERTGMHMSVGIAERQTAAYPAVSPGGWNLIGRTPLRLFDREREGYSLLQPGDQVRFVAVERAEFINLGGDDSPLEAQA